MMGRILGLFLLCCPMLLQGQPDSYHFERLPSETGFTATGVNDILEDRQGFLWLATWTGLAKYDGYSVKMYRQEPGNTSGLRSNKINCLFEDSKGRLWVGASYTGFYRYDRERDVFVQYCKNPQDPNSLSNNNVWAIFEDKEGKLWIGTEKGLNQFDPTTGRFIHYRHDPLDSRSLSHDFVYSITQTPDGSIWVGTEEGLNRMAGSGATTHFLHYNLTPSESPWSEQVSHNFIYKIHPSRFHPDILWVCTSIGLKKIRFGQNAPQQVHIENFMHVDGQPGSLSHGFVSDVWEEDADHVWVSTYGGLNLLEHGTRNIHIYTAERQQSMSLEDNVVRCLFHDRTNNLWIGLDKGVNKLNLNSKAFQNIRLDRDENANASVTCLFPTSDGTGLWAGTRGGGLNFIPNKISSGKPSRRYRIATPNMGDLAGFISSLLLDREGWLWIATDGAGVFRIREKDIPPAGGVLRNVEQFTNSNQLSDNYIMSLMQSSTGDVWLGYWDDGLDRYEASTGTFHHYLTTVDLTVNLQAYPLVHLIETVENGVSYLWIGTRGDGVYKLAFDQTSNSLRLVKHYHADVNRSGSLSSDFINCFLFDKKGRLWIGTENGLNLLDEKREVFTWISEKDGLANSLVQSLLEDGQGIIWASTQRGISNISFKGKQLVVNNLDYYEELVNNAFSDEAAAIFDTEGKPDPAAENFKLAFGGTNGLSIFNPTDIRGDTTPPKIVLTGFRLFNKTVPIGTMADERKVLEKSISQTDFIELNYQENVISIEFTGLHFSEPKKIRYAYQLEGFNDDWIFTDAAERVAHYTNLPYDDYVFKVKAANGNGVWSEPIYLKLRVLPPFWLTGWAYMIYIALFIGLLYGVWRITRVRAELRHSLELEHLEREKAEEVSRLKTQFFTNISHELRTPLTLIVSPLEQLLQERDMDSKKHKLFTRMHFNANRLLHLINQLLDVRKSEAGLMKLHVAQGDLVAFAKEITASFKNLAHQRNIHLKFSAEPEEIRTWFDHDQLEKVLFNLLSNAFKFTEDEGKVKVKIWQDEGRQTVFLQVKDTGIGIPPDQLSLVFDRFYQVEKNHEWARKEGTGIGLALVKSIVEKHRGNIHLESEEGKGTTFLVSLPMGEDHFSSEEKAWSSNDKPDRNAGFILPETAAEQPVEKALTTVTALAPPIPQDQKPLLLLVEDNADIRSYLRENLEDSYRIKEAADGVDGLEKALADPPDLVLADIAMPRMDGIELCRKLKSDLRTSHVPVVLLTARTSLVFKIDGLETGADDYVTKPFHMRLLTTRIKNLIESRRKLREKFAQGFEFSPSGVALNPLDEQLLSQIKFVVERHIEDSNFSVEQLAHSLNMSRMQLYRKLKALTGKSPDQVIRSIRLKRAAQLLDTGRFNVSEVTYMVGYNDLKSFREQFKKEFGVSPSGYESSN